MISKNSFLYWQIPAKIIVMVALFFSMIVHTAISLLYGESCILNSGVAFGIGDRTLAILLQSVTLILILFWFYKSRKELRPGLFLILIAGISNLIDRLNDWYVCDYIDLNRALPIFADSFPIFNINDIIISIGVVYLIVLIIKDEFYSREK